MHLMSVSIVKCQSFLYYFFNSTFFFVFYILIFIVIHILENSNRGEMEISAM